MPSNKEKISFSVFAKSETVKNEILKSATLASDEEREFFPEIFTELGKAVDFLNYGQSKSRLFIMEFESGDKSLSETVSKIHNDPWLHGTVMVIISNKLTRTELDKFLEDGVTDFIAPNEIRYKFPTVLKIVTTNTEIFESQQFISEFATRKKGLLTLKNNLELVPKATNLIMNFCYATGFRNLDTYSKISICLHELLTNAIEHGNCGIGYEEKTRIINGEKGVANEIRERSHLPENRNKRVRVKYKIDSNRALITISDDGSGFDTNDIPKSVNEENVFMAHGRGIMMAQTFVDKMKYNEKGNSVKLLFLNHPNILKKENELQELTTEPVLHLKAGEILFEDNSESNYFYYIISGKLGVYVNNRQVAISTPDDMFVGEMAFLHQNKRTGTVKALANSKLLPISRNGFIDMIKKYPYAGIFLARLLTKRLAERNRDIV